MLFSSARRAVEVLFSPKRTRVIAILDFGIFATLAGIISLAAAFALEVQASNSRFKMTEAEIRVQDFFFDLLVFESHTSALKDSIESFNLKNSAIRKSFKSECKIKPSRFANLVATAGHQTWLAQLAENETESARLNVRPKSISFDNLLRHYSNLRVLARYNKHSYQEEGEHGVTSFFVEPINNLMLLAQSNALETMKTENVHRERMVLMNRISSDLVLWLFLLQVTGYLGVTVADAFGSSRKL